MKTGILTITAAFGLIMVTAEPVKAHDGAFDVAVHLGPAYVRYRDGYRPVDRWHRDWRRYRHHRALAHRRWQAAHSLWHRCYDGRWYRYYDRKHWRRHDKRGRDHKHGHRGKRRHW